MTRKRFFYHLTDVDHGPVLRTTKRPPKYRAESEPDVPRICVAACIPDCLAAKLMRLDCKVWVYRTDRPIKGVKPFRLWDAFLTEEHWMWHPASLTRIDYLEPEIVSRAQLPLHRFHAHGWDAGYKVRIAGLKLAWDAMRAQHPNKRRERIVDGLAEKFLQVPPDEFLVQECDRRYQKRAERNERFMKVISTE